jgi:hypothetical protein
MLNANENGCLRKCLLSYNYRCRSTTEFLTHNIIIILMSAICQGQTQCTHPKICMAPNTCVCPEGYRGANCNIRK